MDTKEAPTDQVKRDESELSDDDFCLVDGADASKNI
eukprot:CAMPEP_0168523520 /NCGR_PEP_ID=MMETSP0405-20121227/10029_1 /TAXON_ID=498012 /ORGANISM="Trichosphaerium sp, Strain Am-I-7 wt" /LENGTH=35 /DNA_ID= /DNA_START= /DNA_END= /DNA_ORIENTATION=